MGSARLEKRANFQNEFAVLFLLLYSVITVIVRNRTSARARARPQKICLLAKLLLDSSFI